ncbi:hypothetical protein [Streptomonospora sediminis]
MSANKCWFCAAPTRRDEYWRFDMHRNADYSLTPLIVVIESRWEQVSVPVPRCERCRVGHGIEKGLRWILIGSALVTGLPSVLMVISYLNGEPWADSWQIVFPWFWTLAVLWLWWGVRRRWFGWRRLAPRPERHARAYPAVVELAEGGWKYGAGPHGT